MTGNHLGAFLRARRAARRPEDVDMASYGVRRVNGLRREEVAVLTGVNADYYTRLEQGRESRPSAQVLDALSRGCVHLRPSSTPTSEVCQAAIVDQCADVGGVNIKSRRSMSNDGVG